MNQMSTSLAILLPKFFFLWNFLFYCNVESFSIQPAASVDTIPSRNSKVIQWGVLKMKPSAGQFLKNNRDENNFRVPVPRRGAPLLMSINDDEAKDVLAPYKAVQEQPILALVDALSILIFAAVGKASHSSDGSIDFGAILITAFPFLISWFAISPLAGSYSESSTKGSVPEVLKSAGIGWILAIPVGCVLRGVIRGYAPPVPFVIVTMISTLVILGGARTVYSVVSGGLSETDE